jgi:hypothetical protein
VTGAVSGTLGLGFVQSPSVELSTKAQNHTVLNRRTAQVRNQVTLQVQLRMPASVAIEPLSVDVVAELAVTADDAPRFEQELFGRVFSPRLGGPADGPPTARISEPPADAPGTPALGGSPSITADIVVPAELDLPARIPGAPHARQRIGFDVAPVEPTEPRALAMRRGLGHGVAINLPGAERVADQVIRRMQRWSAWPTSGRTELWSSMSSGVCTLCAIGRLGSLEPVRSGAFAHNPGQLGPRPQAELVQRAGHVALHRAA